MNESPRNVSIPGRPSIRTKKSEVIEDYEHENDPDISNDETENSDSDEEHSQSNLSENYHDHSDYNSPLNESNCDAFAKNKNRDSSKICIYFTLACVVLAVIVSLVTPFFQNGENASEISIEKIHKKFPSQPFETLENIHSVIQDVLKVEPIHPAVFLFLFNSKTENNDFIEDIAKFASKQLNVAQSHIILDENEYTKPAVRKDYGELIQKFKPDLDKRKVMVIKNLHKMPGKTAQALHSFCDEITPLVDRAVYILTLKVDSFSGKDIHTAEKQLYQNWNDIKNDILAPLVTRVTSTVIRIY